MTAAAVVAAVLAVYAFRAGEVDYGLTLLFVAGMCLVVLVRRAQR